MKKLNQLMSEIIALTTEIETQYPELYKYLDETPMYICETKEKAISSKDLQQYLETLKDQKQNFGINFTTSSKYKLPPL